MAGQQLVLLLQLRHPGRLHDEGTAAEVAEDALKSMDMNASSGPKSIACLGFANLEGRRLQLWPPLPWMFVRRPG